MPREAGSLHVVLESNVERFGQGDARPVYGATVQNLRNDAVIVCAGGQLPAPMLQRIGIAFDTKFGTA